MGDDFGLNIPDDGVNKPVAPRTDADEAMRFLKALRPDGPWVLTAIVPDGPTDTRTFDSEPDARAYIEARNRDQNIYFTGNPCGKPKKKPAKADVTGADFLHTDCDPAEGEAPEAAKTRILADYEDQDPPPSIIVDSGNGLQGLWLLEEEFQIPRPAPDLKGDALKKVVDANAAPIENRNRVLAAATGAPAGTHNVDRLLRLPGTINYPNAAKLKAGRTVCQARIVHLSDARYPLGLFSEIAPEAPAKGNGAAGPAQTAPAKIELRSRGTPAGSKIPAICQATSAPRARSSSTTRATLTTWPSISHPPAWSKRSILRGPMSAWHRPRSSKQTAAIRRSKSPRH
jgi:hypothetical protein